VLLVLAAERVAGKFAEFGKTFDKKFCAKFDATFIVSSSNYNFGTQQILS